MINYQKAIIIMEECKRHSACNDCKYYNNCKIWYYLRYTPLVITEKDLSEVIKKKNGLLNK